MKPPTLSPSSWTVVVPLVLGLSASCSSTNTVGSSPDSGSAANSGKTQAGTSGTGGTAGRSSSTGGTSGGPSEDTTSGDGGSGAAGSGGEVAAGSGGASANGGSGSGTTSAGSGASGGNGAPAPDLSEELFAPERLPRFDITLPQASMDALDHIPDEYVHGSVTYGDITLADVGVRIKGEASLRPLSKKAAFKLKLDKYVDKQTLLGMKRITLNNMVSDPTFLAERLTYHLYRAANLPAPRCNSALVYVNGEYYGVYANVESEDKTFLSRWFASNDGNLYEDAQVDFEAGHEPTFDLETNETLNDRTDLTALISALDSAGEDTYLADLDATLDTEQFLRYTALEGAVDQWDGYSYTYFEPNNFRIYDDPTTGKFTFIPWGMDLSMKAYPFPDPEDGTEPGKYRRDFIPLFDVPLYENGAGGRNSGGRIFVQCLARASCKQKYAAVVREIISLYEGAGLDSLAAQFYEQIKQHVYDDSLKEVTDQEFDAAYLTLLDHISQRSQVMRDDLSAAGFAP